jgi:2,4-dienoyl-CoA reductase (NADPH2)
MSSQTQTGARTIRTKQKLLFTPIKVGSMQLDNRIVFSENLTNYAEDQRPSARQAYYYRERARGGAGLVITEEHSVHPTDHPYEKLIHAFHEDVIPGYQRITTLVHREGAKILAQINHNGGQASGMYTRLPVWAPSAIADPLFREVAKAVTLREIEEIVAGYAKVARYTQRGGFDGVELQCSHSSIVRQFLSRNTNQRTDAYGGGLENRMRILREIVARIRQTCGREYVVGVRLCGDEMIQDGIVLEEAVSAAKALECDGLVDYINTSIGTATSTLYTIEASMHVPPGYALFIPSAIRQAISLPVVGVGRIKDPVQAERVLSEGHADLVGIVRGQIADPHFARKSRADKIDEIRLCISCNQECVGRMGLNRWMGCIETPATGREETLAQVPAVVTGKRDKVVIVGAGPGGLKAAVIAAQRGHRVVVFEKSAIAGGLVNTATKVTGRAEYGDLVRNLLHEIDHLPVDLRLGTEATRANVEAERPDALVVASGSSPDRTTFPGVADIADLLDGTVKAGKKVLIVDQLGFHEATSTAEQLAEAGHEVTIITQTLYVGQDLGITLDLENWYRRARRLGIVCTPDTSVLGIEGGVVNAIHNYSGAMRSFEGFDTVALAIPRVANVKIFRELAGVAREIHRIGDCLAPRRAHAAILEGDRAGRAIGASRALKVSGTEDVRVQRSVA